MSSFKVPPIYGPRTLELHWINSIVNTHGLICGCDKPFDHLEDILKNNKQAKCLFTEGASTGEEKGDLTADFDLKPGELDALFDQPFGEDAG